MCSFLYAAMGYYVYKQITLSTTYFQAEPGLMGEVGPGGLKGLPVSRFFLIIFA